MQTYKVFSNIATAQAGVGLQFSLETQHRRSLNYNRHGRSVSNMAQMELPTIIPPANSSDIVQSQLRNSERSECSTVTVLN